MHTETGFTILTAMSEITQEVIETVADRPGDAPAKRFARQQATALTMMSFLPRDPVETMLAGQCVIFDNLLRDSARDALRGQPIEMKLRTRNQSYASGKMFLALFARFEQLQTRPADNLVVQPPVVKAASPASRPSASHDAAASAPAEPGRHPVPVEPAERATVATKVEAPPIAAVATSPRVHDATETEAQVGAPKASDVGGAVAPAEPSAMVHQDQTRQATSPAARPAARQTVVAQSTGHSPQTAAPAPNGGAGTVHVRPTMPPEQPERATQEPSPAGGEPAGSMLQRNQTQGVSRESDMLAKLAASLSMSPSPGLASQTSQAGQLPVAVRSARVEDPV